MIKSKIVDLIKEAVGENIEIDVSASENEKFGHYSTNVALKLAKTRGENPMEVANRINSKLRIKNSEFIFKTEIVQPGFINFWISSDVLQKEIRLIQKNKKNYGKPGIKINKKIQVEFISANPTGPLTMANGRGGFLGDALSNILEFIGYKVSREYYVNDTGNQIITLGKSILSAAGIIADEENFYKGEYVKKWADENSSKIKKYKDNPLKIGQLAAEDFLKEIKKSVEDKAKIKFDKWISEEKDIRDKGFIDKARKIFEEKNLVYKNEGATWLKTTDFGDDKDRVLITSDGFPTYFLSDTGYYLETKNRGFNSKIIILGPDHYGYVKRIEAAAKIIGINDLRVIVTQAVRLMKAGKEAKMSKRAGEFVTFEEVVDEVGHDAARFFFLMHSPETHMDFDLELAKEQSMKNPVYYVQYAAVRCGSIIKKVKGLKLKVVKLFKKANLNLLNTEEDLVLMRMLARFPETVEESAKNYNPQVLVRYSMDLAKTFHNFYEKERIQTGEKDLTLVRLALIKATRIVFENLFGLLGINLPKKM